MEEVDRQIELLTSSDVFVRMSASTSLVNIGTPAVPALIEALSLTDPKMFWEIRLGVKQVLVEIGTPAIPTLMQAFTHTDSYIRDIIVQVIVEIGGESAIPILIKELDHTDYLVRDSAVRTLGDIGNVVAVPALIKALNDSNSTVCGSAAYALGKIGDDSAVYDLLNVLDHTSYGVHQFVIRALGMIGDPIAVPALIKDLNTNRYDNGYDMEIRSSVAEALQKIATKQPTVYLREAIPILKRLICTPSEIWNLQVYAKALRSIVKATVRLKDIPIPATAVAPAQDLPVPVEQMPTITPAPPDEVRPLTPTRGG